MNERDGGIQGTDETSERTGQREAWTAPTVVRLGGLVEETLASETGGGDGGNQLS